MCGVNTEMIAFIEGKVAEKSPGELVISAGGVGYLLLCSNSTLAEAPAKGENWRCYTVLNVREDAMELFGFATQQERTMFRRLCSVTGVGAKTALGILSALSVRDLSIAIVTGDAAALARASSRMFPLRAQFLRRRARRFPVLSRRRRPRCRRLATRRRKRPRRSPALPIRRRRSIS